MLRSYFFIAIIMCAASLPAQRTDPYSSPPGAPLISLPEEAEAQRHAPPVPLPPGVQAPPPSTFVVVESQSMNTGHDMDTEWMARITATGNNGSIQPQTVLDNTAFFASTDVVVVSSGTIALTAARANTLVQWVQNGGELYLQGEYLPTYSTNQAFATIVNTTGGSFATGSTVAGSLVPTNIMNTYATTPNTAASLSYHWYGCSGGGCNNVEIFMMYGANEIGWAYCPTNPAYGSVVHGTDQDWVRTTTSPNLVDNIIYHLTTGPACTVPCGVPLDERVLWFAGELKPNGVELKWELGTAAPGNLFELSRQDEAGNREVLHTLQGEREIIAFGWTDTEAPLGKVTYHLRLLEQDGDEILSRSTVVANFRPKPEMQIATTTEGFEIVLEGGTFEPDFHVEVYNLRGQQIFRTDQVRGVGSRVSVSMEEQASGVYLLEVKNADGTQLREKALWFR